MNSKSAHVTAGLLITVLALTGCATSASPEAASSSPATTKMPSATPTQERVAAWETFTTDDGVFSFEHPAEWTVEATRPDTGFAENNVWDVKVMDASGTVAASLTSGNGGIGGACGGEQVVPITVIDSQDMTLPAGASANGQDGVTPRFQFTALERPGNVVASVGITNTEAQTESCMFYNLFAVPDTSLALIGFADQTMIGPFSENSPLIPAFATIDEAKAFMDTDVYKDLKRMITSLQITP